MLPWLLTPQCSADALLQEELSAHQRTQTDKGTRPHLTTCAHHWYTAVCVCCMFPVGRMRMSLILCCTAAPCSRYCPLGRDDAARVLGCTDPAGCPAATLAARSAEAVDESEPSNKRCTCAISESRLRRPQPWCRCATSPAAKAWLTQHYAASTSGHARGVPAVLGQAAQRCSRTPTWRWLPVHALRLPTGGCHAKLGVHAGALESKSSTSC